jgi:PAS domain S-box-containing protein
MARKRRQPDAEALLGKLQALRDRLAEHADDLPDLQGALADLSAAAEELAAADEEIRHQAEEVAESRREAEAARNRYHALFDFAPDAYVTTDAVAVIEEANRAAAEMLAVEPHRLPGKPLSVFVAPEDHTALHRLSVGWTPQMRFRQGEVLLQPHRGEPVPTAVAVAPSLGADGRVSGLRWLFRDITDRRRREEEFRALVTHSPDPVSRIDTQGRLLYANPVVEDLHGMPVKQMLGKTMREAGAPPAAAGAWEEAVDRVLLSGEAQTFEFRLKIRGRWRWFQTRLAPEFGPDGTVVTMLAVSREVTETRHALDRARAAEEEADAALAESEAVRRRLEALLRTVPAGVVVVGPPDAGILYVNERAADLYGTDPSGLDMGTYNERIRLLRPDGSPYPPDRLPASRALFAGEEVWEEEVVIEQPDGTQYVVRANAAPVRDDAGRIVAGVAAFEDVTDLVETEAALRQARDGLEEEVARRTSELVESNVALEAEVSRRKQTEAALRETSELLQRLFDTTDLLIAYLDTDLAFVRVNRAYAEAHGREPDDFVGRDYGEVHTDRRHETILRRVLETGRPYRATEAPLETDGSESERTYWDWAAESVTCEDGAVAGVLLTLMDVTEEKRLRDQVITAGETERQRLGQDLHDSLGQNLTGMAYLAEMLARRLAEAAHPSLAQEAGTIARLAQKAGARARVVARGLCPVDLSEEAFVEALRNLLDETREVYGVACALECPGPVRLRDIAVATDLYRIVQEAVHNAVRHAEPTRLRVQLQAHDGSLRLTVEDDGKGLPEEPAQGDGMGLRVMAYRCRRIGGRLHVERRPEGGTRIRCVLEPFHNDANREESDDESDAP